MYGLLQALASTVFADEHYLWDVPDNWSLKQAATVPWCYSIAVYSLVVRGEIRRGTSVLIHGGASSVGLAAIQVSIKACYSIAVYSLVVRGEIRRGTSVLIHGGASSVGLAAIQVGIGYKGLLQHRCLLPGRSGRDSQGHQCIDTWRCQQCGPGCHSGGYSVYRL